MKSYGSGEHGVVPQRPSGCAGVERSINYWAGMVGTCAGQDNWICVQNALVQLDVAGEIYALSGC